LIPRALRHKLSVQAQYRCGYCLTQEVVSGIPLTVEHIVPRFLGGTDEEDNLWMSCRLCNEAKSVQTLGVDAITQRRVELFNPRLEEWNAHFAWAEDGTKIEGISDVGRATIEALSLNSEFRVRTRKLWVEAGYHPPK